MLERKNTLGPVPGVDFATVDVQGRHKECRETDAGSESWSKGHPKALGTSLSVKTLHLLNVLASVAYSLGVTVCVQGFPAYARVALSARRMASDTLPAVRHTRDIAVSTMDSIDMLVAAGKHMAVDRMV
ncbi:hypothetical protein [Alicyclobacillus dauci]|uniref:Uncharacterized protein n=1 Tax=Alicyclobacillus dauci TaxID=1475485 RepID=A0ABY6Z741_9BACL|nr:hypothetical protein [Alicyclobacillus dauci]WAH38604.1 hypothetical protein NZD86_09035 [Alicyclobacillus dauci]